MPLEKRSHSRFFVAARCDQLEQICSHYSRVHLESRSKPISGRCRHNCRLANFILHCTSNFATMDLTPRMIDQSPSQIPGAIR